MERLLIGIIYYQNYYEVLEYINMINLQSSAKMIDIVITVNKGDDDLIKLYEKIEDNNNIFIVDRKINLGYLNGALEGYRDYQKTGRNIKWFVISNTDIVINDILFFEKIYYTNYGENIYVVGPSIFSLLNSTYQNPHNINRIKKNKIYILIIVFSNILTALFYTFIRDLKIKFTKKRKSSSMTSYSLHGSFFALKKDFANYLSKKNYEGFLYSEESYIAEIVKALDKKCYYDSSIEIIHKEHKTTKLLGLRKKANYIKNSLKFILSEFYENNGEL